MTLVTLFVVPDGGFSWIAAQIPATAYCRYFNGGTFNDASKQEQ